MPIHARVCILIALLVPLAAIAQSLPQLPHASQPISTRPQADEPIKVAPNCQSGCYKKQRSA